MVLDTAGEIVYTISISITLIITYEKILLNQTLSEQKAHGYTEAENISIIFLEYMLQSISQTEISVTYFPVVYNYKYNNNKIYKG